MFYTSLIIIQAIFFEAHFLIYRTLINIFNPTANELLILKITLTIMSISFLLASIMARRFHNWFTRIIYRVATTWLGFLIYFLLAAAAYWLVVIFSGLETPGKESLFAGTIFFAAALAIGIYGMINAHNIRVKKISVEIRSLPKAWVGRKAVLATDIHIGQIRGEHFARKIAVMIKELSPDIVFLAGDVFDGMKVDADKCLAPFSLIKVPCGTFFANGNHEEFSADTATYYSSALRHAGIQVLENEKINIDGVDIIGIPDKDATDKTKYRKILSDISDGEKICPRILIKHTPVATEIAVKNNIDLELSGHTHGGQVFPFNIITPLLFKERNYGYSRVGETQFYTSSGAGTWGPAMRLGTDPEIVLISFQDRPE